MPLKLAVMNQYVIAHHLVVCARSKGTPLLQLQRRYQQRHRFRINHMISAATLLQVLCGTSPTVDRACSWIVCVSSH